MSDQSDQQAVMTKQSNREPLLERFCSDKSTCLRFGIQKRRNITAVFLWTVVVAWDALHPRSSSTCLGLTDKKLHHWKHPHCKQNLVGCGTIIGWGHNACTVADDVVAERHSDACTLLVGTNWCVAYCDGLMLIHDPKFEVSTTICAKRHENDDISRDPILSISLPLDCALLRWGCLRKHDFMNAPRKLGVLIVLLSIADSSFLIPTVLRGDRRFCLSSLVDARCHSQFGSRC